jgi:hypothetical protein
MNPLKIGYYALRFQFLSKADKEEARQGIADYRANRLTPQTETAGSEQADDPTIRRYWDSLGYVGRRSLLRRTLPIRSDTASFLAGLDWPDFKPQAQVALADALRTRPPTGRRRLLLVLAIGGAAALVCAGVLIGAALRVSTLGPAAQTTATTSPTQSQRPTDATCLLGYPNSSNTIVIQLAGPGADGICNDMTDPIRVSLPLSQALASNTWAPYRACQFVKDGLTWTIWDSINAPETTGPFARNPGGLLCP